jgi:hypothetical protein
VAGPDRSDLHLKVDDLDSAQTDAVRLGARVVAEQTNPEHWRILSTQRVIRSATQLLD